MKIAVDFDGTCVDHRFPAVGPDVPGAVDTLRALVARGDKLILWTVRSGSSLQDAVAWFKEKGIPLDGINEQPGQKAWSKSPKAYAEIYIDDAAYGCPMRAVEGFHRLCVDWRKVLEDLCD